MIRDIKNFPYTKVVNDEPTTTYTPVHVGNKADIWIGSALVKTSEVCDVKEDAVGTYIELQNSPVHVLKIDDNDWENFSDDQETGVFPSQEYQEVTEERWHYAMEEIDGADDTIETLWFVPGVKTGKIYVDLYPLQDTEYIDDTTDDTAVIVTMRHDAPDNVITEGNDITYKITLNKALDDDLVVTYRKTLPGTETEGASQDIATDAVLYPGASVEMSELEDIAPLITSYDEETSDINYALDVPNATSLQALVDGMWEDVTVVSALDITRGVTESGNLAFIASVSNEAVRFDQLLTLKNVDDNADALFLGVLTLAVTVTDKADSSITETAAATIALRVTNDIPVISEEQITILSGATESDPIVIPTRINDDYEESDDVIYVEIISAEVPGVEFENLVIENPDPVTVTDEEGHDPEEDSGDDEPEPTPSGYTRTLTVYEITSDVAENVQSFITNDTNRVASFDPLVKMKVPVVMHFQLNITTNVNYTNSSSTNYDETATEELKAEIRRVVREYLSNTSVYVESEMVQQLHSEIPMISVVYLPVTADATFFNMKTGKYVHMVVRDRFSLDNVPEGSDLSRQITTNTIQYYTNDDLIDIELR